MGNAVYSESLVCHDTLDTCRSHCDKSECVYVNTCNGVSNKYACLVFDMRWVMWLMVISFFIVLLVCSSLVACYVCRAWRHTFRNAQRTDGDIHFHSPGRVHHVQLPERKQYHRGPPGSRY